MPCYDVQCINGHKRMVYYPSADQRRCITEICPECNNSQSIVIAKPGSSRYFSEKSPRIIENMGHEPVEVRSHWEHQKLMKERGLGWITPKRGMPGSWA